MDATIYHNPGCSTSRNALALMRESGLEPEIVEYLKTPPSRAQLAKLLKEAGVGVRDAIRRREPPPTPIADREPVLREIRDGMRIVARSPMLRALALAHGAPVLLSPALARCAGAPSVLTSPMAAGPLARQPSSTLETMKLRWPMVLRAIPSFGVA